jgi:uncharacterized protein HemX
MHLLLIENDNATFTGFLIATLEKLGSPALILLVVTLGFGIYYFTKQIKEKELAIAAKELQIKELHVSALESSIQNLKIIHEISTTIDKNDERSKVIENLLRENNNFLRAISKSLNI